MNYPFENLNPERFQEFCQSLLAKEYADMQFFPVGQPDGGRDAVQYSYQFGGIREFAIFQIKFVRNPLSEVEPHKWLAGIIKEEAPKIAAQIPEGAKRYILITNVGGTAHPDVGSIDKINEILTREIKIPASCWWRDELNRKLDNAWNLKWAYPELMTGPDLIRYVIENGLSENKERRATTIRAFLSHQFSVDEYVKFKQVDLDNRLLDLFIDVPISPGYSNRWRYQSYHTYGHSLAAWEQFQWMDRSVEEDVFYVDNSSRYLQSTSRHTTGTAREPLI